jgi:hypothetical protein
MQAVDHSRVIAVTSAHEVLAHGRASLHAFATTRELSLHVLTMPAAPETTGKQRSQPKGQPWPYRVAAPALSPSTGWTRVDH